MDRNDGASSSRGAGASLTAAAAAAAGSGDMRFVPQERRRKWGGCFGGLSCFGSQKGGKRIVPASRTPDGVTSANRANGPQSAAFANQNTAMNLSLLAPPSSPASFSNSALPSTAPSPNCFLSIGANSPGGPSAPMYATGPYAHETQLVSPPVFSTYTTEPSTAPLTPPPEQAHLTTPSSPDVPYARFLSSSLRRASKENGMPFMPSSYVAGSDLQASYAYYPGSPSSSLISPASGTPRTGMTSPFPEQEVPAQWGASLSAQDTPHSNNRSSNLFGLDSSRNYMLSADNSFFYPPTSAQFYLDQAQQSFPSYNHRGGKLNVSTEADTYASGGNRHSKACKQDVEEIEAYRASFGFSADEIMASQSYVGASEPADDSFSISPFPGNKICTEECSETEMANGLLRIKTTQSTLLGPTSPKQYDQIVSGTSIEGPKQNGQSVDISHSEMGRSMSKSRDRTISETLQRLGSRRSPPGHACSDAEIDYKRSRSLRDAHGILAWRKSLA